MSFRALVTDRAADGAVSSRVATLDEDRLPDGEVLVAVEWSGLNYKDGLCLRSLGNLVKTYPHVAGIDFAGRVLESEDPRYRPGQEVVLTGWRVGELHWGGFAERARVRGDWLVPLPERLSTRKAMLLGTAGLTAMLAIDRLEKAGIAPEKGPVLVTGAGGGVGSLAVYLLARLGYRVTAVTGRAEVADRLRRLGTSEILDRSALLAPSGRVLDKEQWVAAIDPVGGQLLGEVLKKVRYGGAVAAIGAAGGPTWEASIIPFILRGISLLGIDSVMQPQEARVAAWGRLAELFSAEDYADLTREARLEELPGLAATILEGQLAGRVIVDPAKTD
ncbi:MAG TPA: acryloyl-CoA reductase [Devosiaceae bacterium]|jgi:acrylyl-CoA reductase (NADPH)|nr:acryloyl-CoA reductase [Devosiaceae bacterium]